MLSEEFDKRIREAAEQYHPAYDESAWSKMKVSLNKHLPVNKDNRRRFIFFLLFLTMGTALVFLMIDQPWNHVASNILDKEKSAAGNKQHAAKSTPTNETFSSETLKSSNTPLPNRGSQSKKLSTEIVSSSSVAPKKNKSDLASSFSITPARKKTIVTKNDQLSLNGLEKGESVNKNFINENANRKPEIQNPVVTNTIPQVVPNQVTNEAISKAVDVTQPIDTIDANTASVDKEDQSAAPPKLNQKNPGKLFITASFGPDISKVGKSEWGKTRLQYGVGVGYMLSKKLAIRTGLYVSEKIYSASGEEYHPKEYTYYRTLLGVDANCKILEIPLNIVYRFYNRPAFQLFVSTGAASVIMNKESYGYHVTDMYGQYDFREYDYKNENKHLFSTASLSGGIDYKLTKRFSLLAEPYLKIPLYGIGAGSVNLKSAGILFSGKFTLGNAR